MGKIMPVCNKTQEDISKEWDKIALIRLKQIESGKDLSYTHILTPCILNLTTNSDFNKVIDVGCGTGNLTYELSKKAISITGIDSSKESINLATKHIGNTPNIKFVTSTIEEFANSEASKYSLAVANMTLMDVINLEVVVQSISNLLQPGGQFVFTITHPCFWPFYWKYIDMDWFEYNTETFIEANFDISLDHSKDLITTHIHRPLEFYVNTLCQFSFYIEKMVEPLPNEEIAKQYPKAWKYPRFLGIKCIRK
jgi:ubiquinone/menaquinone biosynthesis C-methylase UbiE